MGRILSPEILQAGVVKGLIIITLTLLISVLRIKVRILRNDLNPNPYPNLLSYLLVASDIYLPGYINNFFFL